MDNLRRMILSRRLFLSSVLASCVAPAVARAERFKISPWEEGKVEYKFRRREVKYETKEPAGTIVVDLRKKWLFYVLGGGKAIRYGIGVGSQYTRWSGVATVTRVASWPTWTPTPEMLARHKHYDQWKDGMPGGPDNPLGARAIYLLNEGGVDNSYRIHGSPWPETIGKATTSGCFRMLNKDVVELAGKVKKGTRVVVLDGKRAN